MTQEAADRQGATERWEAIWRRSSSDLAAKRLDRERNGRRWSVFRELISAQFPEGPLRCVELGSGEGDFSVLLAELGHRITLVDFSESALERARARFASLGLPVETVKADIFDFAVSHARQFDISVSLGTAEHFQGDGRTRILAAHADVLRSGGLSMISVPNAWCAPYRLWMGYLKLRKWWPYGYEEPFSSREARRRAEAAGFDVRLIYKTDFAAATEIVLEQFFGRHRTGWGDGPRLANAVAGWNLNLIGQAR